MGNNGIKDTKGKAKVSLVPYEAIEAIARVREFGVNKYGDPAAWYDNAKSMDFVEAAMRHIGKHMNAHVLHNLYEVDEESGLDHLDHALCSLAMAVTIRRKEQHEETLQRGAMERIRTYVVIFLVIIQTIILLYLLGVL